MSIKDKFFYVNIRDYLAFGNDDEAGEPELVRTISKFSCLKNPDVERFLKKSAIEFTKKSQSVTWQSDIRQSDARQIDTWQPARRRRNYEKQYWQADITDRP